MRITLLSLLLLVCAAHGAGGEPPQIQLVESFPIETPLDHADLPEAHEVWVEMIAAATRALDFAQFYASNAPGSRLEEVIVAIEEAAARGVRVRFLAEAKFAVIYPQTLDRLNAREGIEVRNYRTGDILGGVLHAKYFVVDGRTAYLGSQNFDWRALTHIQELGVRILDPHVVGAISEVFEMDWALAAGEERSPKLRRAHLTAFPITVDHEGERLQITPAFSPRDGLPDEALWDLPQIIALIDSAADTVRVQLLTYRAAGSEGAFFDELESALRRAAARGVTVQMLLADWSKRPGTIEGLQSLQVLPGIEVRLVTIPPWSGGFIPYARVIHAKYLVVDGRAAWIGTSNWEHDYFYASRNMGLIIEGRGFASRLDAFFRDGWLGPYAEPVHPCVSYEPPRIGP